MKVAFLKCWQENYPEEGPELTCAFLDDIERMRSGLFCTTTSQRKHGKGNDSVLGIQQKERHRNLYSFGCVR